MLMLMICIGGEFKIRVWFNSEMENMIRRIFFPKDIIGSVVLEVGVFVLRLVLLIL